MERQTLGLHFGLISWYTSVCLCQCLAKFMGPSVLIIPAQSFIKRPDLMRNSGADENVAKQSCSNRLTCFLAHRLGVLLAKL